MAGTGKKHRVGLVGAGYWGGNLLRNLASSGKVELVAVAEPQASSREKAQGLYPQIKTFESAADMVKGVQIDAAVIATPPESHCEVALTCLDAGLHVLIEKPMAPTADECAKILSSAERAGKRVMVDHTFLYHPVVEDLGRRVRQGEFGKLYYFDSIRANFGKFQKTNVLWDLAPHDLSILDFLLQGRLPNRVSCVASEHLGAGVEDLCYLTLRYADGFLAHLHLNWMAPVKVRTIMVGGDRKMAIYDDNNPAEKLKIYDKDVRLDGGNANDFRVRYRIGDMVAPALPDYEALSKVVSDFAAMVGGAAPRSDGRLGARVVRILEAASKSVSSGHSVEIA